jgi:hypothetical protein
VEIVMSSTLAERDREFRFGQSCSWIFDNGFTIFILVGLIKTLTAALILPSAWHLDDRFETHGGERHDKPLPPVGRSPSATSTDTGAPLAVPGHVTVLASGGSA